MNHDWIREYKQEIEEQQGRRKELEKIVDKKVEVLQNKIGARLKPIVDRLAKIESRRWEFKDWWRAGGGVLGNMYSTVSRMSLGGWYRRRMVLATVIDDDWIESHFQMTSESLGTQFIYRFPFSYQITDDDIREWFEYLLERSQLPWNTGQKFLVDVNEPKYEISSV